jgi:exodeoxyribonuclease-3
MRIITLNANGIRSAARKGFFDWLPAQDADVVCLQETKCQRDQITEPHFQPAGYHCYYFDAVKKGYSGVGLYAKRAPRAIRAGFGCEEFDAEGRYVEADFGDYTVISVYVPSGASSPERLAAKFRFMERFERHLLELRASGREFVLCGDLNIAHTQLDLKNWKGNLKNSGFLPEERAWMTRLTTDGGLVDVYRRLQPDTTDACYTWWSNRGQAYAKNVGWRLDYHLATPALAETARTEDIYKTEKFSDHAPITIGYDW